MIEAQQEHEPALAQLKRANADVDYRICAATGEDADTAFAAGSSTGGVVVETSTATSRVVGGRRIDTIVSENGLSGPFFLKFDTHGVEVDILNGASKTLNDTVLIMMEVYNFKFDFVQRKNLTFWEMCSHLAERGFRCIDLCDPLFRPGDGAFWQIQMFFIRADHPVFASNSYSAKRQ